MQRDAERLVIIHTQTLSLSLSLSLSHTHTHKCKDSWRSVTQSGANWENANVLLCLATVHDGQLAQRDAERRELEERSWHADEKARAAETKLAEAARRDQA